jgi:hypothetical protein
LTLAEQTPPEDDPVAVAVAEFLEARDSGTPLSPAEWLACHPELAAELRDFLDEGDGVLSGLRALRGEAPAPDLGTDERFLGDYELLERLGGNMGVVYRARQTSLSREVVVKVLLRTGNLDRVRFRAEAEAMAKLRHPNIARIFEVSRGDSLPFFSMELYPGGTLADRVEESVRNPAWAAEVVEKVARAVDHAHRRGLLHRDLKPTNVLLDDKGEPVVADFGLAVALDRSDEGIRCGAGTPAYMAPEQLSGEVTVATDVYGLGAVLYELLTGKPPHSGGTFTATLDHIRTGDTTPPRQLNPLVDADLDAICRKCLAREPAARYATAAEVADDLRRYRDGQPTVARPLGPLGQVAFVVRQVRAAADFRTLGPGLVAQAAFVLFSNTAAFALLRSGAAELWVWVAVFASYVPLFLLLAHERLARRGRFNLARAHLWAIWAGHAVACLSVFVGMRLLAGDDFAHGIEAGYVGCAGLNALAFVAMGSLFAGRQYLLGVAWALAAMAMGLVPWFTPLIYAVLMSVCSLVSGLQLRALSPRAGYAENE